MDYLWTPWRYQYVTSREDAGVCVFCSAAQSVDDEKTLVVYRGAHNFVIVNRYPYSSGHVMVVPYQHVSSLADLPEDALVELARLGGQCEKHLRATYHPGGINLGMNLGKAAGAGIADHLHLHVLPRWLGDTNFMTVIGETRIVPEELEVTWQKLRAAFGG